jgi:ribosomal protein L14
LIKKETKLIPIDKSGVFLIQVFHLYKGGMRKVSTISDFVKTSVKISHPEALLTKKKKTTALITNTVFRIIKLDGSIINVYENNCLLIKRKLILRNKDITFPVTRKLKRKKLSFKFPGVL